MSEHLHRFIGPAGVSGVLLPHALEALLADFERLQGRMVKSRPDAFSRDEWAYLLSFCAPDALKRVFETSFGPSASSSSESIRRLFSPRGPVALWLPNNVSLLGPLTLTLLALTGAPVRVKAGSRSEDLASAWVAFVQAALASGPLHQHFTQRVNIETFDRTDPRNGEMAAKAQVRIVFGSSEAAAAIERLEHPLGSVGFSFSDRASEAWIEPRASSPELLRALVQVFALYGQAGCTSPRKVIVLGARQRDVVEMADTLARLWPEVIRARPPMHVASQSLLVDQWATALAWETRVAANRGGVLAVGTRTLQEFRSNFALPLLASTWEEAVRGLPANVQTVGHALTLCPSDEQLRQLSAAGVRRFVPLARMHHFGPLWDGSAFWHQTFAEMEVSA